MTKNRTDLLLEIADDELILGWRNSEWTGIAPFLEEDVAFSSIAQNEIGHARALYQLVADELGTTADELAFDRKPEEYQCSAFVELRLVPDWAATIARHCLYEDADDRGAPIGSGSHMVTEERVWEALAEIPDPEIPPISIVDLGVVRSVAVENGTVHVEFTPTFLGCPALEVMRDQMAERIRELGAEPEVEVVLDDSWSTDRITPEGREKLRESGFAPPAPQGAGGPQLVQLQSKAFKCPYCGSTETRLENIFGQ